MAARDELVLAVGRRYAEADRHERGQVLDEFTTLTGFHRKHAARLLRGGQSSCPSGSRPGRRIYDGAVREAPAIQKKRLVDPAVMGISRSCMSGP